MGKHNLSEAIETLALQLGLTGDDRKGLPSYTVKKVDLDYFDDEL